MTVKHQRREISPAIPWLNLFLSFLLPKTSILPSKHSIKTRETNNRGSFRYLVRRRCVALVVCGLCCVVLSDFRKEADLGIRVAIFLDLPNL